jgi:hypothetical protein
VSNLVLRRDEFAGDRSHVESLSLPLTMNKHNEPPKCFIGCNDPAQRGAPMGDRHIFSAGGLKLDEDEHDYHVYLEPANPVEVCRHCDSITRSPTVVSIVNPLAIKAFGQSLLSRTKTDKPGIDRALLYRDEAVGVAAANCRAAPPTATHSPAGVP